MKIAVCIKQVPDTEARLRLNAEGTWIVEDDLPFVINESDECALEEAIQIASRTEAEIVVFSLGPDRVSEALRKALALGAHRAVHLSDPEFLGGDGVQLISEDLSIQISVLTRLEVDAGIMRHGAGEFGPHLLRKAIDLGQPPDICLRGGECQPQAPDSGVL